MSIKRKKGGLEVYVYDRRTRKNAYVGRFPNSRDGMRRAEAAETEAAARTREDATDGPTVRTFRDSWRQMHPNGQASKPREPSTWIVYMERTKKFAEKYGDRAMSSVTKREARAWCIEHPGSIGPLRAMFSDAARDDAIEQNPFADLRLGRAPGRRNIQPITEQSFNDLLAAAGRIGGVSFRAICALAGAAALREAETFAVCGRGC